jgi:hypothetical protein
MTKTSENGNVLTLKSLNKSNVWDIQENDVFRLWESSQKESEINENVRHYQDILRSAFMIEELNDETKEIKAKYEKQGYKVAQVKIDDETKIVWAVKKRPIVRVTDLTYENIRHISAAKLIEVLDRNFGGGWDSLSQSIKDIIESGFDISTTTLPKDRLHKKGGMYDKKVKDGYDVLEVEKGTWVEAIFAKLKPESEKPRMKYASMHDVDDENGDEDYEIEDNYNKPDEDDVELGEPDDDEINENNYSTMMDLGGDDDITADSLEDYVDE